MSRSLKFSFAVRTFSVLTFAALTITSMSSAKALNLPASGGSDQSGYIPQSTATPIQASPRTYQSAQGPIDLTKLEAFISKHLSAQIEVVSIRWSYNPMDYSNYFTGRALEWMMDTSGLQPATYVLGIVLNGKHRANCELILKPSSHVGQVSSCRSETAKIGIYERFEFSEVDLPVPAQDTTKEVFN